MRREFRRLVLGTPPGVVLTLLEFGATVHRLEVTGGDGVRRNVVLAHGDPGNYVGTGLYLGATIGRYANRIAGGRFAVDGESVQVGAHDRGNHLHGGPEGFDQRVWDVLEHDRQSARLQLVSPDGDQGFPGRLVVTAEIAVEGDDVLWSLRAETDRPTVVNLTQHAYFNLNGEGAGALDEHVLTVPADRFTPVDPSGVPLATGHASVTGTPFDLRTPTRLGPLMRSSSEQVLRGPGIDHNFVVNGVGERTCAVVASPAAGLSLGVRSNQPGLQVYTGNFLDGTVAGPSGRLYRQGDGIALEPQRHPDTPNRPDFGSAVLRPGEAYESRVRWHFSSAAPL